jgi:hypothetical protein
LAQNLWSAEKRDSALEIVGAIETAKAPSPLRSAGALHKVARRSRFWDTCKRILAKGGWSMYTGIKEGFRYETAYAGFGEVARFRDFRSVRVVCQRPGGFTGDDFTRWRLAADAAGNVFVTGSSWNGTNYEFATIKYTILGPIPILTQRIGEQIVLSWTNSAFGLQAAPRISDLFTNVPGATSPYTNAIGAGGQFFRLIAM